MARETWLVLSDLQIPFQDRQATTLALEFAKDLRPDGVILNGDIVDCYSISDFVRNPMDTSTVSQERDEAQKLMAALATVPKRIWVGGNHEDRLRRFVWSRAPQFASLGELEFERLFRLQDHGFAWVPYGGIVNLGKLAVTHGSIVRRHSGQTAKAHYEKYGQSVLIGHTHRLGAYYHTNLSGPHGAWENGCLCRLDPEYVQHPDWQQGFSVVDVQTNGWFNVQQVPVIKGRTLLFGGKKYGR